MMKNDQVDLIINTPSGKTPRNDEIRIRSLAVAQRIPTLTTISAVEASIRAIRSHRTKGITVKSLQEYHQVPSSEFLVLSSENHVHEVAG
jgi:carbamoyl-phosphate synthase large subunit